MTQEAILTIMGMLGGGVLAAIVAGIVTLIRGRAGDKRSDRRLRADITDQVTDMASDWLEKAENRLKAVELENASLRTEVNTLKEAAEVELRQRRQMIDHVAAVHTWIESGAKPPPPTRPEWAPGTLSLTAVTLHDASGALGGAPPVKDANIGS